MMGSVYRSKYTKPVPSDAELFQKKGKLHARWVDGKDKKHSHAVQRNAKGELRYTRQAATYTAKYRDGQGIVRTVSTGCREKTAAQAVLNDLLKRSEQVRSGILTPDQDAMAEHQQVPLEEHIIAWKAHHKAKGTTPGRIKTNLQRLRAITSDCQFVRLSDLDGEKLEQWLFEQAEKRDMSAGSRNGYREACVSFANWCVKTKRLLENPFSGVPKADARAGCRRKRRAMTEDELVRLIDATKRRPLLEAMTIRRGKNKGKPLAKVRPEVQTRLEALGRERALIYKTYALTGLRKNELASLTVGQVELDGPTPRAHLKAADEKNRKGSEIQLRCDLAGDMKRWLDEKLRLLQDECRACGKSIPSRLPPDTPLLYVPSGILRILDRDLILAGIPKKDDRGRTIDVHGLRTTFGTHLSKGGVPLRTGQAAMRHSDPSLTANVYTDPRLLDTRGALDVLPALPLDGPKDEAMKMTGTDTIDAFPEGPDPESPRQLVLQLVPTPDDSSESVDTPDQIGSRASHGEVKAKSHQVVEDTQERRPLPSTDKSRLKSEREDLNLRPLRPERSALAKLSYAP